MSPLSICCSVFCLIILHANSSVLLSFILTISCLCILQSTLPYRDRTLPGGGRNQAPGSHAPLRKHTRNNGFSTAPQKMTSSAECRHELSQNEYPVLGNGKSGSSDCHHSNLSAWGSFHSNSISHSSEKLEHGSSCPKTWPSPLPEGVCQFESDTSHAWESASSPVALAVQSCEPLLGHNHER